jgi:3-deoxy-7-phosphoheptulonate synthase
VEYDNPKAIESTCALLSRLPDLVVPADIELARTAFRDVAIGNGFIVQGGDCAESFMDVSYTSVKGHMTLLATEAAIMSKAMRGIPVLEIGRIAGQYAKPRSHPLETLPSGDTVPTFRGVNVNSPDPQKRNFDTDRLVLGYVHASRRIQLIAQVRHAQYLEHDISKPFYTSHEALHLPLEATFTKGSYNTSATFLWIGARTADLHGAHVEYMRGLRNPIGVKISPSTSPESIVRILDVLCPDKQESRGRVVLITRLGSAKVVQLLPPLVRAVQLSGHMPVWLCDPCHGNTETTVYGHKTRQLRNMLHELQETYVVHRQLKNHLGGIHLEQSGQMVTECMDQDRVTEPHHLWARYETLCDPRLANDQALSLVQQFADFVASYAE